MLKITTPSMEEALERALAFHQSGKLQEADAIYRQILTANPRHADALHWRGILLSQAGHHEPGIQLLLRSLELARSAVSLNDLGCIYLNTNRIAEAIDVYRQALVLNPRFAECYNNLGIACHRSLNQPEAIAAFQKAIDLRAEFPDAYNGLGMSLKDSGRVPEAIIALRRAIEQRPDYPEALNNLGNALKACQEFEEAIQCYARAIRIRPAFAEAHNNMANAYKDMGRLDDAIAAYRGAIAIQPQWAEIYNNLANALKDSGRMEEAAAVYRQALGIRPTLTAAHSNLLYLQQYMTNLTREQKFAEYQRWNDIHALPLRKGWQTHANDRGPNRKLRIGYVSPDFRTHSVAYFIESFFANHDPGGVEVFCYAEVTRPDEITARLQKCVENWRSTVGVPDPQVADMIRNDRIDILVDLCGHTAANRLLVFARKPAPVQITWLGYPATTGLAAMDYRFTDAFADPELPNDQRDAFHAERLIRLPETFLCYRASDEASAVAPPPILTEGHITFGSFNAMPKMNDALIALWSRLLQRFPDSRLILKTRGLSDPVQQKRILDLFANHQITAGRIELIEKVTGYPDHLAMYHRIDIGLDTFPYHGTTTTCEAMWMGVPVVTLAGNEHLSRVGVSILTNVGLPELIAHSKEEYLDIISRLANDLPRLKQLRSTLRDRMRHSPLMDAPRFAKNIERTYRSLWQKWCREMP